MRSRRLTGAPSACRRLRPYYERIIQKTESTEPPHRRLDDARFWLATHLGAEGSTKKARQLAQQVLKSPNSNFKSSAARFLQNLGSASAPRSRRRGPR